MPVQRVSIKHVELGFVDVVIDSELPSEDVQALAKEAFDNGEGVVVTSTLEIVDANKPKARLSRVPKVIK